MPLPHNFTGPPSHPLITAALRSREVTSDMILKSHFRFKPILVFGIWFSDYRTVSGSGGMGYDLLSHAFLTGQARNGRKWPALSASG
jgi:hypothetical protein